jgi:hypothetical protein
MSKIKLILLICLLKPSLILMLNNGYVSSSPNEYFIDTCCSLNENERVYLSCGSNEKIHLNLIQIFYNSAEYCSSELYCCKYETKCSRRITKYSSLSCDEKNSCWIDKTCLKIHDECSSISGLYGQYITINYSCLPLSQTYETINRTDSFDNYQPVPFIVKLLTSDETTRKTSFENKNSFKNFLISNDLKSSPIFLIGIIFLFVLLMLIIYWLADQIGQKLCRQNPLKTSKLVISHSSDEKAKVQSNPSLPVTRVYPSQKIYRYDQPLYDYHHSNKYRYIPYSFNSYQKYIHIQHDPTTGQTYSRTYNPHFNYYSN